MDLRIPPLKIKVLIEPNPLKSRILVRRLAGQSELKLYNDSHNVILIVIVLVPVIAIGLVTVNSTSSSK